MQATLALEDGRLFHGQSFGARSPGFGEAVFHTGMTGYQEVISDPSYHGQIVVMTAPLIGNYGVNHEDPESRRLHLAGLVVREYCKTPSSWRSREPLGTLLERSEVPAVTGVDTRALTRHLRSRGAMRGGIGVGMSDDALLSAVRDSRGLEGRDLAREVAADQPFDWEVGVADRWRPFHAPTDSPAAVRLAVIDCGVKFNILRCLRERASDVRVFPAAVGTQAILDWGPQGIVFSNGPGDPAPVESAIQLARDLMGKLPILGICLGHQVLALALGAHTYKLKFGHHGANHPVKNLTTGEIEITSQNHGFAVDEDSLVATGAEVTRRNLNDGTVEGMRHRELGIECIQYHPEAAPGPWDAHHAFTDFVRTVSRHAATRS